MPHRVLVSCPLIHDDIATYDELFEAHDIEYDVPEVDQQLTEEELLEIVDRYDGVIAGDDEFTARVFQAAANLDVVVKWGIGTDNIDQAAAAEHGVVVRNTPGAFATEVADVVVGYAVMLSRQLHLIDREIRRGNWYEPRGVSLAEKTMGIVGVGNIGSEVARRASALDMEVLGHDAVPIDEDLMQETGMRSVELEPLLSESDVVTLHCPLTSETEGLIGADELDRIGSNGYLINTSRGQLIEESALCTALDEERIAGAALDVFETEPLPVDSPLVELDSVLLGSHNAQNTTEAVTRVHDRAVGILLEELGKEIPTELRSRMAE